MSAVILVYAQKKKGDVCAEQIASLRHHLENILTWMGTNKIKNKKNTTLRQVTPHHGRQRMTLAPL